MKSLLIILMALALHTNGWAGEGEKLLGQVRRQFEARGLWEIGFEQQLATPFEPDTQKLRGTLLACPDGAFRVDAQGLHLLSDGKNLWRWETGGSQVLLERPGQNPDVLLPHQMLILLEERFRVTGVKSLGDNRKRLSLVARSGNESLRDVTVVLRREKNQWWPVDVAFTDFADTRQRFLVTSRRSWPDRTARKKELTWQRPPGMELIDLRSEGGRR